MDAGLSERFDAAFSPALHDRVRSDMERRHGIEKFGFRLAESPVFLSRELRAACERAARGIVAEMSRPDVVARGAERIPERFRVPATDALPHMACVDMALAVGPDGTSIVPRLIEAQGFPSLYGMQVLQADVWLDALADVPGMPRGLTPYWSGLDREAYLALLRRTVVGDADPAEVVLLDIAPETQKTRPDFLATEKLLGVRAVCVTKLVREGRALRAKLGDRLVPVKRIYNRVVFDELESKRIAPPFDWREPLDVAWVPHPNWYWIWSKASIPLLRHEAAPEARFLSDVERPPEDLSRFVLKPLFSFAGRGVVVDVDRAAIERIPVAERRDWLLMEKVEYAPAMRTPDGASVKVEIRVLFLRPDGARELVPAVNLCRLSRAKMHGVDFNKDLPWTGSSLALWRSA